MLPVAADSPIATDAPAADPADALSATGTPVGGFQSKNIIKDSQCIEGSHFVDTQFHLCL
jgi:hypothetical protein